MSKKDQDFKYPVDWEAVQLQVSKIISSTIEGRWQNQIDRNYEERKTQWNEHYALKSRIEHLEATLNLYRRDAKTKPNLLQRIYFFLYGRLPI